MKGTWKRRGGRPSPAMSHWPRNGPRSKHGALPLPLRRAGKIGHRASQVQGRGGELEHALKIEEERGEGGRCEAEEGVGRRGQTRGILPARRCTKKTQPALPDCMCRFHVSPRGAETPISGPANVAGSRADGSATKRGRVTKLLFRA